MRLLLDTHIWLWSLLEPKKLTRRVAGALENTRNELWLSQADGGGNLTGVRTKLQFRAALNGVSMGRHTTHLGTDFVALSQRTFGADNAAPSARRNAAAPQRRDAAASRRRTVPA